MSSADQYAVVKNYRAEGKTLCLLFLWRSGSVYRTILKQMLIWIVLYYAINLMYTFALTEDQQIEFNKVVTDLTTSVGFVPLSFVLGFYVNIVMSRYWSMWDNLPRPEALAMRIASCIPGKEQRDQQIRRTAIRHALLAQILTYRKISKPVMQKYPTLDSLVKLGLLKDHEKAQLEVFSKDAPPFWVPIYWVASLFEEARREERIKDDVALGHLSSDLTAFRGACGKTLQVEQIGIPLAYSQVVIIACYTFYAGSLISRQWVDDDKVGQEQYVPVFTLLQLLIFFGWLYVAESMIHPFGDDPNDFKLVSMIDNHINGTYKIIQMPDQDRPEVTDDLEWDMLRDRTNPGGPKKTIMFSNNPNKSVEINAGALAQNQNNAVLRKKVWQSGQ